MTRPVPEHGTRARYLRGCTCEPCQNAHRAYCKRYRNKAHQAAGPLRDDAQAAATHCRRLAAQGWSERQIADAAGCSSRLVHNLITGASENVNPGITRKILAAKPSTGQVAGKTYVDSTGTVRRGRALVALGYQIKDIADAIRMSADPLSHTLHGKHRVVRAYTAQRMAALYDEWSQEPGPSEKARQTALQRGWHGPDAWDDNIDDPRAVPNAELHLRPREEAVERTAEIRLLASAGNQPDQIAARLGTTEDAVRTQLRRKHPNLYLELTA